VSLLLLFGGGGGGATHALTGAITVSVTAAGTIQTPHPLTGAITARITAAATRLTMAHPLTGALTTSITGAGSLSSPGHPLEGALTISVTGMGRIRLISDPTGVYTVKVGHWSGGSWVVDATLARANAGWIDKILNDVWAAEFSLHTLDPEAWTYLRPDYLGGRYEVQIWRDGACEFWGVPVAARAAKDRVTFTCAGLGWFYTRRYFGPIQNNYVANPDFESGTASWTGVNTTAAASTTWRALGSQSMRLVQASADQDGYLYQRYTTTTTDAPVFFAVKALCHIPDEDWIGPAFEERGLYLEQQSTPGGAAVGDPVWEPINEDTPRSYTKPVRLETGITIPAGVTRTIEVRLYSPGGTIYWDATSLSVEESVGSQVTGDEAVHIITRINTYAQNAAQGKSDLYIGTGAAPGAFPVLTRIYQFFDNGNIWEALSEYPKIGACDLELQWPRLTATTRNLTMFPGGKGTHKAGSPLSLSVNAVKGFSYDVNAASIVTSARVLGQGEGADREIGLATDTSQMDGLVLESVSTAPLEAPIDSLQRLADEDLADAKKPIRVPEFAVPAEGFINGVELGDTVPVSADYGYVQESANRRVVRMRLNCEDDSVAVTVNA
jgi:hypothetical protein